MLKIKNKKNLVIISAIILLAGVSGLAYYYSRKDNGNSATSASGDGINYSPPSKQEKKDAANNKKAVDERESQPSNQSNSFKKVTPLIVSYGQSDGYVQVSARVPGILESSGTCTLTLVKGAAKVSQSKSASPNVSEMSCGFISIARGKLSAGSWSATVSYSSSKAAGTSEAMTIGVK